MYFKPMHFFLFFSLPSLSSPSLTETKINEASFASSLIAKKTLFSLVRVPPGYKSFLTPLLLIRCKRTRRRKNNLGNGANSIAAPRQKRNTYLQSLRRLSRSRFFVFRISHHGFLRLSCPSISGRASAARDSSSSSSSFSSPSPALASSLISHSRSPFSTSSPPNPSTAKSREKEGRKERGREK